MYWMDMEQINTYYEVVRTILLWVDLDFISSIDQQLFRSIEAYMRPNRFLSARKVSTAYIMVFNHHLIHWYIEF